MVGINLFDVYCGKESWRVIRASLLALILQDIEHTWKKDEIAATVNTCVAALKQRFQAS